MKKKKGQRRNNDKTAEENKAGGVKGEDEDGEDGKRLEEAEKETGGAYLYLDGETTVKDHLLRSCRIFYGDAVAQVAPFLVAVTSQTEIGSGNLRGRPESVDRAVARR